MTALTADRTTPERAGEEYSFGVAAAKKLYAGALVALNASGYATLGATATGLIGVGRAEEMVDNSAGSDGDLTVRVRAGIFRFGNSSAGDLIAIADIGKTAWIVDDQTVAKTSASSTRSPAGTIVDVDSQGVWVRLGWQPVVSAAGAALVANNLSDVTAATARGNLGVFLAHQGNPTIAAPGAEAGDVITTAVQLTTIAGADLAARGTIHGYLSADANGDAITGLTIASLANGTDGLVIPLNAAKTAFVATSEADGDIDIAVGCTGTGTCYLILVTPMGKLVASTAITFA